MPLNVLVVDDSAVMRRMVIKTLALSGLPLGEVFQAADGSQGLALLDSHQVDLALVDINMPVMNGEEMIRRMRASPSARKTAVIVVSTDRSESRAQTLLADGVRVVHKPFTPEELRDAIVRSTGGNLARIDETPPVAGHSPDF